MKPINITVQHPDTVSAPEVLDIVNSTVDSAAPVIVSALPTSSAESGKISLYVTAGEVGLALINSIVQQIQAKHQAASK
jgi:hypothetical protein